MVKRYEKLFEKFQKRFYSRSPDFLEKPELLLVPTGKKKSLKHCQMDKEGKLILKTNDYLEVVKINKSLIIKALQKEYVNLQLFRYRKYMFWRDTEASLKSIYIYLLNYLLEKDDSLSKEYFDNLEQTVCRQYGKNVKESYIYLICTISKILNADKSGWTRKSIS